MHKLQIIALTILFLVNSSQSVTAFTCVTNFDAFSGWGGTVNAVNNAKIVSDPSDSSNGNSVLEVSFNVSSNYLFYILDDQSLISAGATGTVFFRMYFENPLYTTFSFGLGSSEAGGTPARMQAQAQMQSGTMKAFNGTTETGYSVTSPSSWVSGEWYNVWFVINSTQGKYEVWSQLTQDDAPVKFETSSHHDGFVFRSFSGVDWSKHDTNRFTISFTSKENTARTYFDDLHVDNSGINLTIPLTANNAIPEPATYAVGGGLLLFLLIVAKHHICCRKTSLES
jgi:hypothetical protein